MTAPMTAAASKGSVKHLSSNPRTLKYFPLRRTAKLFAIADVITATLLLGLRFLIATRIVTFPLFQLLTGSFHLLVSCLGVYQVFSENVASFPVFLAVYAVQMAMNVMAMLILGLQTFDMGLMTSNCGDSEICRPHVLPIAVAGWVLVATSCSLLAVNGCMFATYWRLNGRLLDEQDLGLVYMHYMQMDTAHHRRHHRHHHQHYPSNYSHSGMDIDLETAGSHKICTPLPKRPKPSLFSDPGELVLASGVTGVTGACRMPPADSQSKTSTPTGSVGSDYRSFPISPLDMRGCNNLVS